MKKTIMVIALLTLIGCGDVTSRKVDVSECVVLNKRASSYMGKTSYEMYIYNGNVANWYSATSNVYGKYEIQDTISGLQLTTIKK